MGTKIVVLCQVAPSSCAPTELLLPLLHSDMIFFSGNLMEILFFYSLPSCSESNFSDTIVPKLKKSLSLTLKHFTPLAGKIIFPLTTAMPISQYITGDSVSMAIAVSDADFTHLTGNLSRDADQFHDLVARVPPATYFPDFIKFPVSAFQVTLFPGQGICIGITMHHCIGDGSTIVRFTKAWASINKLNGDAHLLSVAGQNSPSFYDRSGVQEADNLATTIWGLVKKKTLTLSSLNYVPTHKVRASFVLSGAHVRNLINLIMTKRPSLAVRVSSSTIACALVWASLARSAAADVADDDDDDDDEPDYFHCYADCRARLNPPLPDTYFGNCLAPVLAESTHGRLKGDQGIVFAAEAIALAIRETINDGKGVLDNYENRLLQVQRLLLNGKRMLRIAGSSRYDMCGADFGWGRSKKFEAIHIDVNEHIFLCESGESQGGIEITLSMPKAKMDAFAASFEQRLGEATKDACSRLSKL